MATIVEMPQLGETVTSGTIISWMKEVGDQVAIGDILVEISTDKVDTELPSGVAGTLLEILIAVGETVDVGVGLCVIAEAGSAPDDESSTRPVEDSADVAVNEPEPPKEVVESPPLVIPDAPTRETGAAPAVLSESARFVSPVVRRLAREHDVDLSAVVGTGQGGRVTRRDLENFLSAPEPERVVEAEPMPKPEPEPVAEPAVAPALAAPPSAPAADATPAPAAAVTSGEESLSRMRQVVAANMVKSLQTAVHTFTSI